MSRLFAGILIVLLTPILLVAVLIYFMTGHEKIIFSQYRIGLNQSTFKFFKFRTLSLDTQTDLKEREFPFGRFLRKTSLDELPQLWNILKGEMSFVGPRPLPVEYLPQFNEQQKKRFLIKPGLTGWAQVNGRTSIDWSTKLALDVEYVEKRSFWFDSKILIKTVVVLLFERNDNSLEEESFIDYSKRIRNKPEENNPLKSPLPAAGRLY